MTSIDTSRYTAVPKLPTVGDMCAAIRAGDTVEAIAARHDAASTSWIRLKIRDAGYDPTTGQPVPKATVTAAIDDGAPYPPLDGTQPCAGLNPELFFPHPSRPIPEPAKAACARCPFHRACLAYALTHDVAGVWGGTTETQRHDLRKAHGITARQLADELDAFAPATTRDQIDHLDGGGCPPLTSPVSCA